MKKIFFTTGLCIILTCIVLVVTNGVFANVNLKNDNIDTNIFKEQIQTLIYNRASVMVSDLNIEEKDNKLSSQQSKIENQTRTKISQYREALKKVNEIYCDLKTDIEILEYSSINDRKVSIKVKETTFLTIAQSGIESGYSAEHIFIFEKNQNDEWIILEDRYLEPIGLLPLQQAKEYVYDNTDVNQTETDFYLQYIENLKTSSNMNKKNLSLKAGYNYSAMAAYLERYWLNYNPTYRNFNNQVGDCTNFVSQALKAGGWADKPGWYQNANYWWYNNVN